MRSLFPIPGGDTYINSIPIIIMFHGEMQAWYTLFFELHRLLKEHFPFLLLVPHYSYLIRQVSSCCGFLRYCVYCLYKGN